MHDYFAYEDCFARYSSVNSDCLLKNTVINPKLSILIPTYNRFSLLKEAILSAISQETDIEFEVIVVDNNENDIISKEIFYFIKKLNSRLISLFKNKRNIGMFGNWNRSIELARAEYFTILNDDDLLCKNWLSKMSIYLDGFSMQACLVDIITKDKESSKKEGILFSLFSLIESIVLKRWGHYRLLLSDLFVGNPVHASLGVVFHKKIAIKIGGYNEKYWPVSDYVFNINYFLNSGIYIHKEKLAVYRFIDNESLNYITMLNFVHMTKDIRKYLISKLCTRKYFTPILIRLNEKQASINAYDYYLLSQKKCELRHEFKKKNILFKDSPPSKFSRAITKLGWIFLAK